MYKENKYFSLLLYCFKNSTSSSGSGIYLAKSKFERKKYGKNDQSPSFVAKI